MIETVLMVLIVLYGLGCFVAFGANLAACKNNGSLDESFCLSIFISVLQSLGSWFVIPMALDDL